MRGKKGDPQLSGAEETAKLNSGTNIKRFREEIDKKKVAIKELEDRLKLEA